MIIAASCNLITAWNPAVGRLMSTVIEMKLAFPLCLAVVFVLLGVLVMIIEYFKKD